MDPNDNKQAPLELESFLFLKEENSDILFKVQDQTIPAHKQVLIERSKYFKNLFNSGMMESRQEIIEINDCSFIAFQEFLRFLYLKEAKLDTDLAMKLVPFADKYLQDDLMDKCLDFLRKNRNMLNVFEILDFARARRIGVLKYSCMSFLKNKKEAQDAFQLIQYLSKEHEPEFSKENLKIRNITINLIIEKFSAFCQKPEQNEELLKSAEEFLIKNIDMSTIGRFGVFIGGYMKNSDFLTRNLKPKGIREEILLNLKNAIFDFTYKNFERLKHSTCHLFNNVFLINFVSHVFQVSSSKPQDKIEETQQLESQTETKKESKKKLKRGEPKNSENNENDPKLKKTKKK